MKKFRKTECVFWMWRITMVTRTDSYPDVAIPPGEYLAEEIEARGIPQTELARITYIRRLPEGGIKMVKKEPGKGKNEEPKQGRRKQKTQKPVEPMSHAPTETPESVTGMFNAMMPMVMMVLVFSILTPMLKGMSRDDKGRSK
ncbi:MAG: hypothetical protein HYX84_00265 [Chloroflexi bacterium]|nr:hypothetical protein [Chloroflexota bacterium]